MKIAMIGMRGTQDGLGGVEKAVREISVRLVKQGVDVTCFCRPKYNDMTEYKGIKLINTATLYSKHMETALYVIGAMLKAMRGDYDVIHIHAMATSTLAWIPHLFSNKKVVVTIHGLDWQRAKWGFIARSILKFGELSAVKNATHIICVSLSLHTYFKMRYINSEFSYIPNGCDNVDGTPPAPEDIKSKKYFLYMGRLVPEKGVHKLIEAFKQVDTDMELIIAGPESHSEDYTRQLHEQSEGDDRIRFIGSISGERKETVLAHAFMFILPSDIEGLPIALLEAASYGVCPVITSIPTALEVLGEHDLARGFVFDPHCTNELVTILETALAAPELVTALGDVARTNVLANYNWDTISKMTRSVYENIGEQP